MIVRILPPKLKQKIRADKSLVFLFNIFEIYIACVLILAIILKFLENFTWMESIWQVWQTYSTVGYGNKPAEGLVARTVTMFFSFVAIALYAAMGGAIIEFFIKRKEKKRLGFMDNPISNGYVIFNLPETHQMVSFIEEIRFTEGNVGICIVDNKIEELPSSIRKFDNIHFIKGSLVEQDTYKRANLAANKTVIVFPNEPFNPDSDAGTKTIVDLTAQFTEESATRIMHVLVKRSNEWLFKGLPSIPVLESMSVLALVQESQDQFSAPIVQRLLANTEGANPKTVIPEATAGFTWRQFQRYALDASEKTGVLVNVFALVKNGEPSTCPDPKTVIEKDDRISLITFNGFDWKTFEQAMQNCAGQ